MNKSKTAVVSGLSGQDGSYLAKFLLNKGYKVYGVLRYATTQDLSFIKEYGLEDVEILYADLTDDNSLAKVVIQTKSDEFYHLAAQSHVGLSFNQPEYTMSVTGTSVTKLLEQIRLHSPHTRFVQAGSSEQFGDAPAPQNENTPFRPRSPYAVAKVAAYYAVKVYRETYDLHASTAISFNHESVCKNTPVIIKLNNNIEILPIEDLFRSVKRRYEGILDKYLRAEVWNGTEWTRIINGTCYQDRNKPTRIIQTRQACCETTLEHDVFLDDDTDVANETLKIGDRLFKANYPEQNDLLNNDLDLVKFVGFVVGDGHIDERGRIRLTGCDTTQLEFYAKLLCNKFGWSYRLSEYESGFGSTIYQLDMQNDTDFGTWLRSTIYSAWSHEKMVPNFVLNASSEVKKAFFEGYYDADGRKAGHESYEFKGFTTSSATLCLGLIYILQSFSSQIAKCKCEYREGRRYYYVQLTSPNTNGQERKARNEIIKITDAVSEDGWFFDIQTESQTFATGPNLCKVHNSPRRGKDFVTRKVTDYIGRLVNGLVKDPLLLGNLDAKRDWSAATDIVMGLWLIAQQSCPSDYVLASGETHTVREFVSLAFERAGMSIEWQGSGDSEYATFKDTGFIAVKVDPKLYRPCEVPLLLGNFNKAKTILGWYPIIPFEGLVDWMVQSDIDRYINDIPTNQTNNR